MAAWTARPWPELAAEHGGQAPVVARRLPLCAPDSGDLRARDLKLEAPAVSRLPRRDRYQGAELVVLVEKDPEADSGPGRSAGTAAMVPAGVPRPGGRPSPGVRASPCRAGRLDLHAGCGPRRRPVGLP